MPALRVEDRVPAAVAGPGPCMAGERLAEWDARQRQVVAEARAHQANRPIEISARDLSAEDKARVWRYLKANSPERVAFLTEPTVRELVEKGWAPLFTIEECRAAGVRP